MDLDRASDQWNVSHFLYPASGEVGRGLDGQLQLFPGLVRQGEPQFPGTVEGQLARMFKQEALDNLREERLAHQIEQMAALVDRLEQLRLDGVPLDLAKIEPKRSRMRSQWDTYAGFRSDLVEHEREFTGDRYTKAQAAGQIGCSEKSITRRMAVFGLPARFWPPSTWPEQQAPVRKPRAKRRHVADT